MRAAYGPPTAACARFEEMRARLTAAGPQRRARVGVRPRRGTAEAPVDDRRSGRPERVAPGVEIVVGDDVVAHSVSAAEPARAIPHRHRRAGVDAVRQREVERDDRGVPFEPAEVGRLGETAGRVWIGAPRRCRTAVHRRRPRPRRTDARCAGTRGPGILRSAHDEPLEMSGSSLASTVRVTDRSRHRTGASLPAVS